MFVCLCICLIVVVLLRFQQHFSHITATLPRKRPDRTEILFNIKITKYITYLAYNTVDAFETTWFYMYFPLGFCWFLGIWQLKDFSCHDTSMTFHNMRKWCFPTTWRFNDFPKHDTSMIVFPHNKIFWFISNNMTSQSFANYMTLKRFAVNMPFHWFPTTWDFTYFFHSMTFGWFLTT